MKIKKLSNNIDNEPSSVFNESGFVDEQIVQGWILY